MEVLSFRYRFHIGTLYRIVEYEDPGRALKYLDETGDTHSWPATSVFSFITRYSCCSCGNRVAWQRQKKTSRGKYSSCTSTRQKGHQQTPFKLSEASALSSGSTTDVADFCIGNICMTPRDARSDGAKLSEAVLQDLPDRSNGGF